MNKRVCYGLPINPSRHLEELRGGSFCVSFATRDKLGRQLDDAIAAVGPDEILLLDNGAYSAWRSGVPLDVVGFARWASQIMARCPQAVAVVPDVIDGDAAANDQMLSEFAGVNLEPGVFIDGDRTMAVWHMHEPLDRLTGLVEAGFCYVAIGSSGDYATVGTPEWHARITQAFAALDNLVASSNGAYRRPWIHMMRAQSEAHRYPFDSSDSCNVAVNHGRYRHEGPGHVERLAARVAGKIAASCDGTERPTICPPAEEAAIAGEFRHNLAALCGQPAQPVAKPAAQLELFDRGQAEQPAAKWIGQPGPLGNNVRWTRSDMPGITIRHCGHPTALRPYYITTAAGDTLGTFPWLEHAKAVAAVLAAEGIEAANQYTAAGGYLKAADYGKAWNPPRKTA